MKNGRTLAILFWILLCCSGCRGFSIQYSSNDNGAPNLCYIAKTHETFKFADLLLLQAQLEATTVNNEYNCQKLVLDMATGSNLLLLEFGATQTDSFCSNQQYAASRRRESYAKIQANSTMSLSSSLSRCDWVAEVLACATSAQELISLQERQGGIAISNCTGWTLDYIRMNPPGEEQRNLQYTLKTILCAVAWIVRAPPVLDTREASDELILVETIQNGIYLGRIKFRGPIKTWVPPMLWPQRQFQYSSAINPSLAEIVVDLVLDLASLGERADEPIHLLDPTCGSGTFLAFALMKRRDKIHVHGWDLNPQCIEGTRNNLNQVFGKECVERKCHLTVRDSSLKSGENGQHQLKFDCLVANLPWGKNAVDYVDQNLRILEATRARLKDEIPCVFVHKEAKLSSPETMKSMGYEILGEAHIPPLNFDFPKSRKKKGKHKIDFDDSDDKDMGAESFFVYEGTRRHLKVTVARTIV